VSALISDQPQNTRESRAPGKRKTALLVGGPGSVLGSRLLQKLSEEFEVVTTWFSAPPNSFTEMDHVHPYKLDVADAAAVDALLREVHEGPGDVDILINNAGVFLGHTLPMTPLKDWQYVLNVNLTGVFNCCKAVSRKMMQRRTGKIINIASAKGLTGGEGESAYAASKAGVIALSKSLARELAPYNVTVNVVCPGYLKSELNKFDARLESIEQERALLDISNNLDDAVNLINFLCGESLKSVTGQVFHADSRIHCDV
jgi:3-oxoacyl-[acyl-carrier protein] reductase